MLNNKDNSASSPWPAIFSLTVACFVMVTTEFLPIGLLTNIAPSLGVSTGTAGLMVTMPGIVAAVAAPALSLISGRLDRRLLMLGLSLLLMVSNLVAALAVNFPMMLLGRVLLGICVGGFWSFAANYGPGPPAVRLPAGRVASVRLARRLLRRCGIGGRRAVGAAAFADLGTTVPAGHTARSGTAAAPADGAHRPDRHRAVVHRPLRRLHLPAAPAAAGVRPQPIGYLTAAVGLWRHRPAGHLPRRASGGIQPARHLHTDRRHAGGHFDRFARPRRMGALVCATNWMFAAVPQAPEAGQALLVCVIQIALASGALLGGEVVDWQGVSSAMLFGGALILSATLVFGLSLRSGAIGAKQC